MIRFLLRSGVRYSEKNFLTIFQRIETGVIFIIYKIYAQILLNLNNTDKTVRQLYDVQEVRGNLEI